ncbi:unnamed protein product [Schistosoma turkestanicum]|nr:unnamed protein product [Schistosoma turkestanicum]
MKNGILITYFSFTTIMLIASYLFTTVLHQTFALSKSFTYLYLYYTAPAVQRTGLLPSYHWTFERVLAVVVTAVSMHSYWGFDGVIKDYAFERRYGPALMPILRTLWKLMAGCGFAGLLYFNFNDVGFISAVKKLWAL